MAKPRGEKVLIGKLGRFNVYQDTMSGDFYRKSGGRMTRLPQKIQDAIIGHRTGYYSARTRSLRFRLLRGFKSN